MCGCDKTYLVSTDVGTSAYTVDVIKYTGNDAQGLISIEKDGKPAVDRQVQVNNIHIGRTNYNGNLRAEIPETFEIMVMTNNGPLTLSTEEI